MHTGLFITGFWLGTFKFMFAHWLTFAAANGMGYEPHFYEIFIAVETGCLTSMSIFYWSSGMVMRMAAKRREKKKAEAIKNGKEYKKKIFTRTNKGIVWIKQKIGIYGVTFIAPLVMSIPIGSVVCAKFYGEKKITYPLMIIFSLVYSFLMCLWIELG
ncbi:MAG: hypothetical protein MI810_23910 [Flavobacteriales bacterium]|nr:hypothetical protein [Flavobacteriales bacterium]